MDRPWRHADKREGGESKGEDGEKGLGFTSAKGREDERQEKRIH